MPPFASAAPDALNARSLEAGAAQAAAGAAVPTISRGRVTFVDAALPQGVVVPDANLAVFSIADLNARMDANRARSRRKVDITQITFPFKPGDYVVHATHGIALFSEIARQEVGGKERDYFLLEYADGDQALRAAGAGRPHYALRWPRRRQAASDQAQHRRLDARHQQGAQERQKAGV